MTPIVMRWLTLCCLAAGCGVQIDQRQGAGPDGAGPPRDGPITPTPDAAPVCSNGRVVYLNFEGTPLSYATASDATQNRASWLQLTTSTAPKYRATAADRDQQILAIANGVRLQLASFPIQVVTTRPAAGPYVMIVYGGTSTQVGSKYSGAVNELDCGDAQKSDLAWISDNVLGTQKIVNFTIGAIGFGLGLTATLDPLDCMCGWDNNCTSDNSMACRLSPSIMRDPAARQVCPNLSTQNEQAAFAIDFCR
jgi:hypothetical protein